MYWDLVFFRVYWRYDSTKSVGLGWPQLRSRNTSLMILNTPWATSLKLKSSLNSDSGFLSAGSHYFNFLLQPDGGLCCLFPRKPLQKRTPSETLPSDHGKIKLPLAPFQNRKRPTSSPSLHHLDINQPIGSQAAPFAPIRFKGSTQKLAYYRGSVVFRLTQDATITA